MTAFISPSNIGPGQILLIIILIVFLFGGKKIPEISRALGRSMAEFRKGREEAERELAEATKNKAKDESESKSG
jgi:sec-independent protein translocase protein TatA